jgi:hypothetical protein
MSMSRKQSSSEIERFQLLLSELATCLMDDVNEAMGSEPWVRAVLDVRGSGIDGSTFLTMLKVGLPDAATAKGVPTSNAVDDLVSDIWRMKNTVLSDKWYGLKLKLGSDGRCDTAFNYDSKCVSDPSFLDMGICE